jgi:hypothetical protein
MQRCQESNLRSPLPFERVSPNWVSPPPGPSDGRKSGILPDGIIGPTMATVRRVWPRSVFGHFRGSRWRKLPALFIGFLAVLCEANGSSFSALNPKSKFAENPTDSIDRVCARHSKVFANWPIVPPGQLLSGHLSSASGSTKYVIRSSASRSHTLDRLWKWLRRSGLAAFADRSRHSAARLRNSSTFFMAYLGLYTTKRIRPLGGFMARS